MEPALFLAFSTYQSAGQNTKYNNEIYKRRKGISKFSSEEAV